MKKIGTIRFNQNYDLLVENDEDGWGRLSIRNQGILCWQGRECPFLLVQWLHSALLKALHNKPIENDWAFTATHPWGMIYVYVQSASIELGCYSEIEKNQPSKRVATVIMSLSETQECTVQLQKLLEQHSKP